MVTKFIIDRKTWLRGEMNSCLLRGVEGKKCCLGFYLEACGVPLSEMVNIGAPADLPLLNEPNAIPAWLLYEFDNSVTSKLLMVANDHPTDADGERETQIRKLFADQGVEVEFI